MADGADRSVGGDSLCLSVSLPVCLSHFSLMHVCVCVFSYKKFLSVQNSRDSLGFGVGVRINLWRYQLSLCVCLYVCVSMCVCLCGSLTDLLADFSTGPARRSTLWGPTTFCRSWASPTRGSPSPSGCSADSWTRSIKSSLCSSID